MKQKADLLGFFFLTFQVNGNILLGSLEIGGGGFLIKILHSLCIFFLFHFVFRLTEYSEFLASNLNNVMHVALHF